MKARTERMTRTCSYCGLPVTYRHQESLEKADRKREHLHSVCARAKKTAEQNEKTNENSEYSLDEGAGDNAWCHDPDMGDRS